jgi:hypothetical protein
MKFTVCLGGGEGHVQRGGVPVLLSFVTLSCVRPRSCRIFLFSLSFSIQNGVGGSRKMQGTGYFIVKKLAVKKYGMDSFSGSRAGEMEGSVFRMLK